MMNQVFSLTLTFFLSFSCLFPVPSHNINIKDSKDETVTQLLTKKIKSRVVNRKNCFMELKRAAIELNIFIFVELFEENSSKENPSQVFNCDSLGGILNAFIYLFPNSQWGVRKQNEVEISNLDFSDSFSEISLDKIVFREKSFNQILELIQSDKKVKEWLSEKEKKIDFTNFFVGTKIPEQELFSLEAENVKIKDVLQLLQEKYNKKSVTITHSSSGRIFVFMT